LTRTDALAKLLPRERWPVFLITPATLLLRNDRQDAMIRYTLMPHVARQPA
jgi:hypothetical protein